MNTRPSLVLALCIFLPSARPADLNGRIVVTRAITKKHVTLPVYELRGAATSTLPSDPVHPTSEYGNMVVFLDGDLPRSATPVHVSLTQQNQQFAPRLLVVPVGSTVSFPNSDPVFHNVFSLSATRKFDLGYYPQGRTRLVTFNDPGVVQVYCHLHPNMHGAIVVVPNQWHTQPAEDGTFSLTGVPPGTYRLMIWHMSAGYFHRTIQIEPDRAADNLLVNIPIRDTASLP